MADTLAVCEACKSPMRKSRHPPISQDEFRSTYAIPKSRQVEISLVISDEEQGLQNYDSEIRRLQHAIKDLEAGRRALQEQVERRRSYLSVLRRVPEELWVEIFSHLLGHLRTLSTENELERVRQEGEWRRLFKAPFTLSHVCAHWREIVINTPSLWSHIYINLHWWHPTRAAELYIERSREQGLDIALYCSRRWDPTIAEQQRVNGAGTFQALISHMARFRKLSMFDLQFEAEQPRNPTFSRLEYLHIGKSFYPPWFREAVRHAPRLDKVVMEHSAITPFKMISYSSLRFLEILKLERYAEQFLEALPTLRNLESLTISRFADSLRQPILPPTKCESLRHLSITHYSNSPGSLLQSIDLSDLQSLAVDFQRPFDSLADVITTFSTLRSLQTLVLSFFVAHPLDRIVNIIRDLPNLTVLETRLRLYSPSFIPAVSNFFSDVAEIPTLCSALETLSLTVVHVDITEEILESFTRMVESRVRSGAPALRDVRLVGDFPYALPLPGDIVSRLRASQAEGIDCLVKNPAEYCYFPPNIRS